MVCYTKIKEKIKWLICNRIVTARGGTHDKAISVLDKSKRREHSKIFHRFCTETRTRSPQPRDVVYHSLPSPSESCCMCPHLSPPSLFLYLPIYSSFLFFFFYLSFSILSSFYPPSHMYTHNGLGWRDDHGPLAWRTREDVDPSVSQYWNRRKPVYKIKYVAYMNHDVLCLLTSS